MERQLASTDSVCVALVGKYVELPDAYLSVVEALTHGGIYHGVKVNIKWVPAQDVTPENVGEMLAGADGVLVPGGFGARGLEGKIAAIQYARENGLPFLGLCLGMQMAVVEFARHVCGMKGAHSSELDPDTPYPVIDLMEGQRGVTDKGGTMRLGAFPCRIDREDTAAFQAYRTSDISEQAPDRYEFNNEYRQRLTQAGLRLSGLSPDGPAGWR